MEEAKEVLKKKYNEDFVARREEEGLVKQANSTIWCYPESDPDIVFIYHASTPMLVTGTPFYQGYSDPDDNYVQEYLADQIEKEYGVSANAVFPDGYFEVFVHPYGCDELSTIQVRNLTIKDVANQAEKNGKEEYVDLYIFIDEQKINQSDCNKQCDFIINEIGQKVKDGEFGNHPKVAFYVYTGDADQVKEAEDFIDTYTFYCYHYEHEPDILNILQKMNYMVIRFEEDGSASIMDEGEAIPLDHISYREGMYKLKNSQKP